MYRCNKIRGVMPNIANLKVSVCVCVCVCMRACVCVRMYYNDPTGVISISPITKFHSGYTVQYTVQYCTVCVNIASELWCSPFRV